MKTRSLLGILATALGLGLIVVWSLSSQIPSSVAAPAPGEAKGSAKRPLHDTTPIHYVATGGTDSGDCSASGSACRTVQYAVDQAGEGDEIRVSAGTYTGVSARAGVTQAVYISKTVTIRGGYSTTNWTTSDPEANPTTLDAQRQGRVLYITGKISPTVNGLRVTGGTTASDGGGVRIHEAQVTITSCHIFSNTADWGAGLALGNSPSQLSGNVIYDNVAGTAGGGLGLYDSPATVHNNIIVSNAAGASGAAMYLNYSDAEIRGNEITDHPSTNALFLWHSNADLDGNTIARGDTGVFLHASEAALSNNAINEHQYSGVQVDGASPRLLHNTIDRNQTGVSISDRWEDGTYYTSTVTLTNTILSSHDVGLKVDGGNTATMNGVLWHDTPVTVSKATTATVVVQNQLVGDPTISADDGYHLTPASAAIDAGVDSALSTDVDGQPRPAGRGYDLGADEFHGPGLVVTKHASHDHVESGDTLTYTIRLTNTGTVDLHPAITDTLPGRVTPSGVRTWTPGVIAPGGTWKETIIVGVEAGDTRTLANVVEATTEEGATDIYTETTHVPGTIWVTSTADSGPGTLRWALEAAATGDTVKFDSAVFPPASPATIAVTSGLPSLDDGNVKIDGSDAGVILSGAGIQTDGVSGLLVSSDGNAIRGLQVVEFPQDGIAIRNASDNTIGGPDEAQRNIISYNGGSGIALSDNNTISNTIQNNWIGIDADSTGGLDPRDLAVTDDGTLFLADFGRGVFKSTDKAVTWQTAGDGLTTSEMEIVAVSPQFTTTQRVWAWGDGQLFVSEDAGASWSLLSDALSGTVKALEVSPNYATDQTLLTAVKDRGIYKSVDGGATWTQVHQADEAECVAFSPDFASDQVILAGLDWGGILRSGDGGDTWVESNTGLPGLGVSDLAFAADGQTVLLTSDNCSNKGVYRSTDGGQTWVSSGSGLEDCGPEWQIALSPDFLSDGIAFAAEDTMFRSTDGSSTWAGSSDGVFGSRARALAFSPHFSVDQTVYFANFSGVFRTTDGGEAWIWAAGNLADRGNNGRGVEICCGAGATQIINNVIGRNAGNGISIWDPEASGSVVAGNLLGLAPDGVTRAGNGSTNIWIDTPYISVTNNTCAAGAHGGLRSGTEAHHLTIRGNRFGTDASGSIAIGNSYDGISLKSSHDTVRDNLVSGNWGGGIYASEHYTGTSSSVFAGNLIGLDASGSEALPNQGTGLVLNGDDHTVGGTSSADRNVISGNEGYGLAVRDGARHNVVSGNYIGINVTGTAAVGNGWGGIAVYRGATDNAMGGDTTDERNVISGNGGDGLILWDADGNTVSGNLIGTDPSGLHAIGNARNGIQIGGGASQNTIGGSNTSESGCSGECNLIRANGGAGVEVAGSGSLHNTISHNAIYANEGLGIDLHDGGNTELPAPVIYPSFDIAAGTASGYACANCTVDLFSDAHGEGRWHEGSTTADGSGEWHIAKAGGFAGPELTATATDGAGNTSEFGQDWPPDPPPPPVVAAPVCGVTNRPQPTFAGTAQMGSTVRMGTAGQPLGETTTDDWNRWRLTPSTALTDATHLITATATTVWGTSDEAGLTLTVDSDLCYDPTRVTFVQRGRTQHPRDTAGCVDPAHDLEVVLWPSEPVTVRVPVRVPTATVYAEVNSVKYDLTDPDGDGVFTGEFTAPDSGNPVIRLVVDGGAGQRIMRIGSTIDPDGYVYDAKLTESTGVTETMAGVTVTLYVSDTVRHRWVAWDAALYDQVNPQVTGDDGYFSFFTPPGTYRLVAQKEGYFPFTSPDLVVVDEPVRHNIPLVKIPLPHALEKRVTPPGEVDQGDEITYTLTVSGDLGAEVGIYDPLLDTTFVRFVEQPVGISHADGVITGSFALTPTQQATVSFVARVDVPDAPGETTTIVNRACAYPAWRTRDDCIWDEITTRAFAPYHVYLPLVLHDR